MRVSSGSAGAAARGPRRAPTQTVHGVPASDESAPGDVERNSGSALPPAPVTATTALAYAANRTRKTRPQPGHGPSRITIAIANTATDRRAMGGSKPSADRK